MTGLDPRFVSSAREAETDTSKYTQSSETADKGRVTRISTPAGEWMVKTGQESIPGWNQHAIRGGSMPTTIRFYRQSISLKSGWCGRKLIRIQRVQIGTMLDASAV